MTYINGKDKVLIYPCRLKGTDQFGFKAKFNGVDLGWFDQSMLNNLLTTKLGNFWNEKDLV